MVNAATNLRSVTKSAADGNFVLPQLPPGACELTAESRGFRGYTRQGIILAAIDSATAYPHPLQRVSYFDAETNQPVLSVRLFEKTPILRALPASDYQSDLLDVRNQLILSDF